MTQEARAGNLLSAGIARAVARSSSPNSNYDNSNLTPEEAGANFAAYQSEQQKAAWASWVNGQYVKCRNARLPFERQWYINLAMYQGRQYIAPVSVAGEFRLTAPRVPAWRVRLIINKIRTSTVKYCSKLSSSRPIPTVLPATNEDEDYASAKVAEKILQHEFATAKFNHTYRDWIFWGAICGVSFMKSYWDKNALDPNIQNIPKARMGYGGVPLVGDDGEPLMETSEPAKGSIITETVNPFHVYVPDLLSVDLEDQPYIIHVTTRSIKYVQKYFRFNATPDARATNSIMDAAFLIAKGSDEILDSVLVKEMWLKPNVHDDFPEGGLITVVNNQVVQVQTEWPWPFTEFPFYKYDGLPTGGFYSDSLIVDQIPLQKEYNKTRSQMVEIKNLMSKPKILAAEGSINPRMISSDPGQAILYRMGYDKPEVLPAAEVPATMINEVQSLAQDFDDISNQHEISRGDTPNNAVSSGTAIAFLQEQDDTALSYPIGSIEAAIEMLGKHYLKYVAKYWTEPRLIRVTGKDSDFEAKHWKGSDLRGNTDVKVQTGSALPYSKAARTAQVTEFMQLGYIDPVDGLDILDMGAFNRIMDEMLVDKRQAQRENLMMSNLDVNEISKFLKPPRLPDGATEYQEDGQPIDALDPMANSWSPQPPVPVNSWDNHQAHIEFHNRYRKTQEFELLEDPIKQAFELHVQAHQMALTTPAEGQIGEIPVPVDPNAPPPDPNAEAAMEQQAQEQELKAQQGQLNLEGTAAEQQRQQEAHEIKMRQEEIKTRLDAADKVNKIRQSNQKKSTE